MRNAVLFGTVAHARLSAPAHKFRYGMGMLRLDIEQLEPTFKEHRGWSVNSNNLGCIRRRDYLRGGADDFATAARDVVEKELGFRPEGRIELLTQPRCLGTGFNPINLYRCHDQFGELVAVIVEVNNTPWGEQIAYVLAVNGGSEDDLDLSFAKQMHVSPFQPMDFRYQLRWIRTANREVIRLNCWKDQRRVFTAGMQLDVKPLRTRTLARLILRNGLIPARVLLAIHWEALRLWFKRARYYPYPGRTGDSKQSLPSQ